MSTLSIGLSGLLVGQRLIDLTGQNITNANTPTYHRQVGDLAARVYGASQGSGVELKSISRVIDRLLEAAVSRNASTQGDASAQLDGLNQLQALLAPGDGSLHDSLTAFFNAAEQLSAQPDDLTQRRVFLFAARNVTDRLNSTVQSLDQLHGDLMAQVNSTVTAINTLTVQIGQLNQRIHDTLAAGGTANELQDQRDGAIAQLAQLIDVRAVPQEFGTVNVLAGGVPLVLNTSVTAVRAGVTGQNQIAVYSSNSQQLFEIEGGKLGGMLSFANSILPQVRAQFDTFARALVTQMDNIQATGLGLNGPMTSLTSQRLASATNIPLASANLAYPAQSGDLYVTVTNLATGQRSLTRVSIDPATQSLNAVAGAISAVPHVQAIADPQTGALVLMAQPGYGFDFTGNFSSSPDTNAITGTTVPTFSGAYTGTVNDTLHFRFVGSGTVGSTVGLALEVRNDGGTLLSTFNVGQGYDADAAPLTFRGVNVNLSGGTVNSGDAFTLQVASNPDTSGLLTALGLHSFFVGDTSSGLSVNPDLLAHPEWLALSKTGLPGDGSKLARYLGLRDQPTLNGGTQTFQRFLEDLIGNVGGQTQDLKTRKDALDALGQQLETQRQGVSGVDPNEELMKLVQYQRLYQMSAHFISVANQAMDEVLNLFER